MLISLVLPEGSENFLEIGREFVRQYYTMLSERPQDVYRFYGHESFFRFDAGTAIQGQQVIIF